MIESPNIQYWPIWYRYCNCTFQEGPCILVISTYDMPLVDAVKRPMKSQVMVLNCLQGGFMYM